MTDRSTDNPGDQPVPLDPREAPAADSVAPEQEAIAEVAAAMGVEAPAEQNEPSGPLGSTGVEREGPVEAAEPEEPVDAVKAEGTEEVDGAEEAGGEAASDLGESELEAAATAAESEHADTETLPEEVAARSTPAGAAARGAAKAPTSARAGGRTALEVDPALRIRDRASQVFVALTVIVFVAIFANAMLFGVGGALNAVPSPSPVASPASSGSSAPASGSPAPSGTAAPATTAPAAPGPTFTAAPSAS